MPLPEGQEVIGRGGAAIVEPGDAELIAGPLYGEEGIVAADCDLGLSLQIKRWFDAVGHYSREDVLLGAVEEGGSAPVGDPPPGRLAGELDQL